MEDRSAEVANHDPTAAKFHRRNSWRPASPSHFHCEPERGCDSAAVSRGTRHAVHLWTESSADFPRASAPQTVGTFPNLLYRRERAAAARSGLHGIQTRSSRQSSWREWI